MRDLVEVPEITDDGLVIKQAIEMKSPAEVVCGATWRNELPITKSGTPWEEPEELFHEQEFNEYPIEQLLATIRYAVKEVAEFVQSPIPLVAASALNTISTAVQGQYDVRRADGLEGPTSLFFLSIAESGLGSSDFNSCKSSSTSRVGLLFCWQFFSWFINAVFFNAHISLMTSYSSVSGPSFSLSAFS